MLRSLIIINVFKFLQSPIVMSLNLKSMTWKDHVNDE